MENKKLLDILNAGGDTAAKIINKALDIKLSRAKEVRKIALTNTVFNATESVVSEGKLKAGKGKVTIDIDYINDDDTAPGDEKKYKVKIKTSKSKGTADVTGEKKNVLAFLTGDYDMDEEDIEDLFPELLESVVSEALSASEFAKGGSKKVKETEVDDVLIDLAGDKSLMRQIIKNKAYIAGEDSGDESKNDLKKDTIDWHLYNFGASVTQGGGL